MSPVLAGSTNLLRLASPRCWSTNAARWLNEEKQFCGGGKAAACLCAHMHAHRNYGSLGAERRRRSYAMLWKERSERVNQSQPRHTNMLSDCCCNMFIQIGCRREARLTAADPETGFLVQQELQFYFGNMILDWCSSWCY